MGGEERREEGQRWAMGSVTERILAATTLPVLIIRSQHMASEHAINQEEAKQAGVEAQ